MQRYYARVSGHVQGVGFRWFVRQVAARFHFCGYVANLPDGSVEMELQGEEALFPQAWNILREGNGYSRVDSIDIQKRELAPDGDFRIEG